MRHRRRITNIALIFTLIGMFLCQDLAYSRDTYCLRVPVNTETMLERLRNSIYSAAGERFSVSELYNMHSKLGLEENQRLALDAVTGEKLKVFKILTRKIKAELTEESTKRPILISCYVNDVGMSRLLDDRPEHLPLEFKKRNAWAEIKDGRAQRIILLRTKDKPEATIVMDRDPETQIIVSLEIYRKGKKPDYRELTLAYSKGKLIGSCLKTKDKDFQKLFDGEKEITLSIKMSKMGSAFSIRGKKYYFGQENDNRKIKAIISNGLVRRGVLEEDENRPALEFEYEYFENTQHILWTRERLKGEEKWRPIEHFIQAWDNEELVYSSPWYLTQATLAKLSKDREICVKGMRINENGYFSKHKKHDILVPVEFANREVEKATAYNGIYLYLVLAGEPGIKIEVIRKKDTPIGCKITDPRKDEPYNYMYTLLKDKEGEVKKVFHPVKAKAVKWKKIEKGIINDRFTGLLEQEITMNSWGGIRFGEYNYTYPGAGNAPIKIELYKGKPIRFHIYMPDETGWKIVDAVEIAMPVPEKATSEMVDLAKEMLLSPKVQRAIWQSKAVRFASLLGIKIEDFNNIVLKGFIDLVKKWDPKWGENGVPPDGVIVNGTKNALLRYLQAYIEETGHISHREQRLIYKARRLKDAWKDKFPAKEELEEAIAKKLRTKVDMLRDLSSKTDAMILLGIPRETPGDRDPRTAVLTAELDLDYGPEDYEAMAMPLKELKNKFPSHGRDIAERLLGLEKDDVEIGKKILVMAGTEKTRSLIQIIIEILKMEEEKESEDPDEWDWGKIAIKIEAILSKPSGSPIKERFNRSIRTEI